MSDWSATERKVVCEISGIDSKNIKSVSYTQTIGTGLTMGTCCSATAEVELTNISQSTINSLFRRGNAVEIKFGADSVSAEKISADTSIGKLYVISCELTPFKSTSNYNAKLSLGDGFSKEAFGNAYSALSTSTVATEEEIITAICAEASVPIENIKDWGFTNLSLSSIAEGTTNREVIGWLASLHGDCAYFNEDGKLTRGFLGTKSYDISADQIYLDGFEYGSGISTEDSEGTSTYEESIKIKGMQVLATVDKESKVLYAGSRDSNDRNIKFTCPWMTDTILDDIWDNSLQIKNGYDPLTVKWRGNPSIELMSKLRVDDANGKTVTSYLMERDLNFDGGLSETYKAFAPDTTESFDSYSSSSEGGGGEETPEEYFEKSSNVLYVAYTDNDDAVPENPEQAASDYHAIVRYASAGYCEFITIRINELPNGYRFKIPIPVTNAGTLYGMTSSWTTGYSSYPDIVILPISNLQYGETSKSAGWHTTDSETHPVSYYVSSNDISESVIGDSRGTSSADKRHYCRVFDGFVNQQLWDEGVYIKIQYSNSQTDQADYWERNAYLVIGFGENSTYAGLSDLNLQVICFKRSSTSAFNKLVSIYPNVVSADESTDGNYWFPYDPQTATPTTTDNEETDEE